MSSPTFFSQHTYADSLTDRELAAEIQARIAGTPWRWAFPFHKIEALRLRLARVHLTGSARQRVALAVAWGLTVTLISTLFGAFGSAAGLTSHTSLAHDLYMGLFMGLWFSLIGYWVLKVNGEAACYEIARDMDARGPARPA